MYYPEAPFTNNLNDTIINLNKDIFEDKLRNDLKELLRWLCTSPKITSFRVNTLRIHPNQAKDLLEKALIQIAEQQGKSNCSINITFYPLLPDTIIVSSYQNNELDLKKRDREIIIDAACGNAVLRGAHVFAPGVMAMQTGTKVGNKVSVYADISKQCKKGLQKIYECPKKVFVANGIVKMVRNEIFKDNLKPTGIAVQITDSLSGCSCLNETNLPVGFVLLQNLPSIICGHVLNPKPGDIVLDLCAAPGNKTSHLAALMENDGIIIALDKTRNKLKQLNKKCEDFSLNCVYTFEFDSTKSYDENIKVKTVLEGPPFSKESFDKILLDAPCSGLGNRPQLLNTITDKVVTSYVPLQRKLFTNAVYLLKKGGTLVYSTCTITLAENEGMVAWALEMFDCLELIPSEPYLGGPGWPGTNLTEDQLNLIQRFGPQSSVDSIGFFITHFRKKL